MSFVKPVVGVILLLLGLHAAQMAVDAQTTGSPGFGQLVAFTIVYLSSGVLVLLGKEIGAWGGVTVTLVSLLIVGALVLQSGGQAELPLLSWLSLAANLLALAGAILLLRADPPGSQEDPT